MSTAFTVLLWAAAAAIGLPFAIWLIVLIVVAIVAVRKK